MASKPLNFAKLSSYPARQLVALPAIISAWDILGEVEGLGIMKQ